MAPMTQISQVFPTVKTMSRIKTAGLKVRTNNFTDVSSSNVKAQAIASTDWRKTASATSSSGIIPCKIPRGRRYDTSNSSDSSPLCIELECIDKVDRRYPKAEQVAWEAVISAPAKHFPASPSSRSSITSLVDVTAVHINEAKPMAIKVNGEDIVIESSFSFDVIPIKLDHSPESPASKTVGYLKRIYNPAIFPRRLLRDTGGLPADIMKFLEQATHEDVLSESRDRAYGRQKASERNRSDFGFGDEPCVTEFSPAHETMSGTNKARFQNLIDRLYTDASARLSHLRSKDPAILAAKAKDATVSTETKGVEPLRYTRDGDAFWKDIKHQVEQQESSHDSGYSSGKSSQLSGYTVVHTIGSIPEEGTDKLDHHASPSKRLNPAAAEFISIFGGSRLPMLSPKKLTRAPLTNLFPEAGRESTAKMYGAVGRSRFVPGLHQPRSDLAVEVAHQELFDTEFAKEKPAADVPPSDVYRRPNVNYLSSMGVAAQEYLAMQMQGTLNPPPGLPVPSLNTFGTFPPQPMPHMPAITPLRSTTSAPFDMGQPPMAGMNAFGTFPGNMPPPPVMPPIPDMMPAAASLPPYMGAPAGTGITPPLFNAGAKSSRPHWPVTQKPRDHDPLKQQQYEAYLEWRKANEPGYHMRCKMRQAQRVVRQHTTQRQDDPHPNHSYKAVAEKAKETVNAIHAAAEAKKKSHQKSICEEFGRKVREKSDQASRSKVSEGDARKSYAQVAEAGAQVKT